MTSPSKPGGGGAAPRDQVDITMNVVEQMAHRVATEVPGVHHIRRPVRLKPMSGLARDLYALRDQTRGVHAELMDNGVLIEIALYVDAGTVIPPVTDQVRAKVRETVESTTRLKVRAIHVQVLGEMNGPAAAAQAVAPILGDRT